MSVAAPSRCSGCQRPILWARTREDRFIPLDLEPAEGGNIRLEQVTSERPLAIVVPVAECRAYPGQLFVTHFATCPYGDEFRRRREEAYSRSRDDEHRFWGD